MKLRATTPIVWLGLLALGLIWFWASNNDTDMRAQASDSNPTTQVQVGPAPEHGAPFMQAPYPRSEERPLVKLETSLGDMVLELFHEAAPGTVTHILRYVDEGFYDGLIFHRIVPGFVVQAGGYDHKLTPRPTHGPIPNESDNGRQNLRGTLAMARLQHPDSADSQFYINLGDNNHLDAMPGRPGYTVFGQVVEGLEVVSQIEQVQTGLSQGMPDVPQTPIIIHSAARLH